MSTTTSTGSANSTTPIEVQDRQNWIVVGVLIGLLVLSYLNSLIEVTYAWEDPQYSHGYLIPFFAGVLLWMRREALVNVATSREMWIGVGLIVAGLALRVYGARSVNFTLDRMSVIPCLLGIFCLVGGFRALHWTAAPILFLVFMFPLPGFLVDNILRPLKTIATQCSNYGLQTLGFMTFRDGNRIVMDAMDGSEAIKLGVVDACSGLRMLTIFLALCAAFAMLTTHRPLWERIVIFISAVPIALFSNIIRITITGVLYQVLGNNKLADWIFHDAAGFFMIPIAGGLLYLEYQILSRLFIEEETRGVGPIGVPSAT